MYIPRESTSIINFLLHNKKSPSCVAHFNSCRINIPWNLLRHDSPSCEELRNFLTTKSHAHFPSLPTRPRENKIYIYLDVTMKPETRPTAIYIHHHRCSIARIYDDFRFSGPKAFTTASACLHASALVLRMIRYHIYSRSKFFAARPVRGIFLGADFYDGKCASFMRKEERGFKRVGKNRMRRCISIE